MSEQSTPSTGSRLTIIGLEGGVGFDFPHGKILAIRGGGSGLPRDGRWRWGGSRYSRTTRTVTAGFSERVLEALSRIADPKRKRGSVAGEAASAHNEAEAERIAMAALRALNAPTEASQLQGKGKWVEETTSVAALIRKRTGVKNRWVAARLGMGHEGSVTRAIRRVNENPVRKINLTNMEAMLVSRD